MAEPAHAPLLIDAEEAAPVGQKQTGWLTFAGVMFLAAAALNVLYGVSAVANDRHLRAGELLFGSLALWGVIYLVLAAAMLAIGLLILRDNDVGLIAGGVVTLIHLVVALTSIGAYPLWSVIAVVIDGLILYGLCTYDRGSAPSTSTGRS